MSIFEKFKLGFTKSANKFAEGFKEIIIKNEIDDKKTKIKTALNIFLIIIV